MKNQFPIGKYEIPKDIKKEQVKLWINQIKTLSQRIAQVTVNLNENQLTQQYREGSWDVRTLIHHIADSHLHGYIRTKLILTENCPSVSTFEENEWFKLSDNKNDINDSIMMITGIHNRWVKVLESLNDEQFERSMHHPENGLVPLKQMISLYAWHGEHHLQHIKIALEKLEK
ncbi:YfiT family bacillithiol transferase [Macrococcus equipercicus]|uniref:Metal-dependent hydrolase n=1 Tax=Macrococcus equipercicus TaxID=69967 RepID=A0A9Q9F1T6_9STAP|nr:putative metal-dependent hydrolase [Macrococcus equipercicus]KAA1039384.1 putative metal-dependent hydrolase [Macrococcus equipercicus]UTH13676.1 putative metal-dependent hydrolase [Macrococcus equipercicus]